MIPNWILDIKFKKIVHIKYSTVKKVKEVAHHASLTFSKAHSVNVRRRKSFGKQNEWCKIQEDSRFLLVTFFRLIILHEKIILLPPYLLVFWTSFPHNSFKCSTKLLCYFHCGRAQTLLLVCCIQP